MNKRITHILIMLLILMLFPSNAVAQDGSEPEPEQFVVIDPDTGEYTLNLDVLKPAGKVVKDPPESWLLPSKTITIGDDLELNLGKMVYNQYVSPEGYYVLVPTLYTAIVMSLNDESPFNTQPIAGNVNGWVGMAGSFSWLEGMGYTKEDVLNGDWKYDPEFWNGLFKAINDPKSPLFQGSFFAPPAILIFDGDPFALIDNQDLPVPSTPPPAVTCPTPSVMEAEIYVSGELVDPAYPVVVGQDPAKRGADLRWRVEITPVVFTWYTQEVVDIERICREVGSGGSGCPSPKENYDSIVGAANWDASMEGNPEWNVEEKEIVECVEHVEVYPVQLSWVRTYAHLSQESRDWIEKGELQKRYPGAHLYQPDWEWVPPLYGALQEGGAYVWEWVKEGIQFRDPGQYGMSVMGAITGTPATGPRTFLEEASGFSVWLYEATISK